MLYSHPNAHPTQHSSLIFRRAPELPVQCLPAVEHQDHEADGDGDDHERQRSLGKAEGHTAASSAQLYATVDSLGKHWHLMNLERSLFQSHKATPKSETCKRSLSSSLSVSKFFTSGLLRPVLKKFSLDLHSIDNYRPISLPSTLSKLLKLIMLDELRVSFLPHELQFVFAQCHGTMQASLRIVETMHSHLRRRMPVFARSANQVC